jgi:hypothetical protein
MVEEKKLCEAQMTAADARVAQDEEQQKESQDIDLLAGKIKREFLKGQLFMYLY